MLHWTFSNCDVMRGVSLKIETRNTPATASVHSDKCVDEHGLSYRMCSSVHSLKNVLATTTDKA
jgi:hypothetical protein